MDKGQTVDENGHVIACIVIALGFHILIDDLQTVVVNVLFVDELNIFGSSVITAQYLYMVGLNGAALFDNTLVSVGEHFREEAFPLTVSKGVVVQKRELPSEIGDQTVFVMDGKVFISLCGQQTDKFLFKSRFALETVRA